MSREHHYRVGLTWRGASKGPTSSYAAYSREFAVEVAGKPSLVGSADALFRGDPSLMNPEDLLLAALSSCHMLSYLAECARAGVLVLDYSDEATGTMALGGGGGQFVSVKLRPRVIVGPGSDLELALKLHHNAHEACFIARSVNFPVTNEPEVILGNPDGSPAWPQP